jgi:hypothetical protein
MQIVGGDALAPGAADTTGRTLRAEIQSLRDENDELKLQNRDRDRELADEREKSERVISRRKNTPHILMHVLVDATNQ